MFDELKEFMTQVVLGGLFAMFCGFAGYLNRQITGKQKIRLIEALIRSLGSGVAGMLVMMLCIALQVEIAWVGFIVGTAGWMGADATMILLEKIVHRKMNL